MDVYGVSNENGQVAMPHCFQVWSYFQRIVEENRDEKVRCITCGNQFQLNANNVGFQDFFLTVKNVLDILFRLYIRCYQWIFYDYVMSFSYY